MIGGFGSNPSSYMFVSARVDFYPGGFLFCFYGLDDGFEPWVEVESCHVVFLRLLFS